MLGIEAGDADESGDGAGIKVEISPDFFNENLRKLATHMTQIKEFVWVWFLLRMIMELKKMQINN